MVAAEAEVQGEEQGQQAVVRQRVDPSNLAELMAGGDVGQGGLVVDDILVVSEDDGEQARRMAVEGGPGQLTAPNVAAAAKKSILPEVRRREEDKGRRGQSAAGAAGSGDSSVHSGRRRQTGKGGKGQAGTSGARHATEHQEGKGGKEGGQGRQWPQPQRSFKQQPSGSLPQVGAALRAEEEREARRQQAARYDALAHMERQRRRHQPPEPGPDTIDRLEMRSGKAGSGHQGGQKGLGGEHSGQPSGGLGREEGQAGQSSAAAAGHRGQREGGQESGSERCGQTGSAVQGRAAGLEEGGKGRHGGHGAQGKGEGQEGLQGKGHRKAGLPGVGSKGHGAAGGKGKGQGKEGGHGYMGSPVFQGKRFGWWVGVVPPAIPPVIPPFPPPPYPAMQMMYPPPTAYPGVPSQANVQQRPQTGGTTWGAQGGKGEEHRRACERIGEEEKRLREREVRVMGGADRVAARRTEGPGRPQRGGAQAVKELQRAWADLRRRQERVERAEQEGGRHGEGGGPEGRPPLMPFRQPAIPPEQ